MERTVVRYYFLRTAVYGIIMILMVNLELDTSNTLLKHGFSALVWLLAIVVGYFNLKPVLVQWKNLKNSGELDKLDMFYMLVFMVFPFEPVFRAVIENFLSK